LQDDLPSEAEMKNAAFRAAFLLGDPLAEWF
jgi:hypothetical protein